MNQGAEQKACSRCRATRPLSEFHVKRAAKDGLMPICKSCARAKSNAYRLANKEQIAKAQKARYDADPARFQAESRARREVNRDARLARRRAQYATNPEYREKQRVLVRAWIADHPEVMAQHYHRKRARRAGVPSGIVDMARLWTGECGICAGPLDAALTFPNPLSKSIDHIVPLARGGTHTQGNVQWAHLRCNTAKGARMPN